MRTRLRAIVCLLRGHDMFGFSPLNPGDPQICGRCGLIEQHGRARRMT